MKLDRLTMLAGVAGAMFAATSAQSAFTHLSIEQHQGNVMVDGGPRDVYRAYVNFNNPADVLTGIFGNVQSPMSISLNGNVPFNSLAGGTNVPVNAEALAQYPETAYDSFATIGLTPGYVGDPGANLTLSPGFPNFITAAGITNNTNVAWATAGPLPQGSPVNGRVLFMQITVNAGGASPSGNFGINYLAGGTLVTQHFNAVFWVPAPGTLALLGLAAFVGRRRRTA